MTKETLNIIVPEEYNLERVDKFIIYSTDNDFSRSYIQKLIKSGNISANDNVVKSNYKVKTDDSITIIIPEPKILDLKPENIDIDIIHEDDSIAVLNKQPGLVVHPGPGNWNSTLVNALLYRLKNLSSIGDVIRPGIVHRLDKDTSGLMVVAKNDRAHRSLVEQFSSRTVKKAYLAVVVGKPVEGQGMIDKPIGRHRKYRHKMTITETGREAITGYKVKKIWNLQKGMFSLLDINIYTGRSHQIRVHMSGMGNPVVGDPIYSKKWERFKVPYLLLASYKLGFTHPDSGEFISFEAGLPEHISNFISKLDKRMSSSLISI